MTTGFEGVMGGAFMIMFNIVFSLTLAIVNFTAVGILSADKAWFGDAVTIWLSTNTIVSLVTILLLILSCIVICNSYRDPCKCSLGMIVMFWVAKLGLVIWG